MLSEKRIKVEIDILNDDFAIGKTLVFENLPIDVNCVICGLPSGNKSVVKIYGVDKEKMNMITLVRLKQLIQNDKKIRLFADDGDGYKLLYEGFIISAVPVYDSAPNVYIRIESSVGVFPNSKGASSTSFSDKTPAFQCVKQLCNQYGYDCVKGNPYRIDTYYGVMSGNKEYGQDGFYARLNQLMRDFNLDVVYNNKKYVVFQKDGSSDRKFYLTPNNYIGYPSFNETGIRIKTDNISNFTGDRSGLFLHDIITISGSDVEYANGSWSVWQITYNLQSFIPNGKWEIILDGVYYNEEL